MTETNKWYEPIICFFIGHHINEWRVQGQGMDKPTFNSKVCYRCKKEMADY